MDVEVEFSFSDAYKTMGGAVPSPDGTLLASSHRQGVRIQDMNSMAIENLFHCEDAVSAIRWSPDSKFVLCAQYARGIVQVFSLEDPNWKCRIDEGEAGLTNAIWSPDSRFILTFAEFQIRLTVWSLLDSSAKYLRNPKFSGQGHGFSPDGKYFAVAERKDCKDFIHIVSAESWEHAGSFHVDTQDLENFSWSPDSASLCVWDTSLTYRLLVYMLDGQKIADYSAYDGALGIKSVSWSPNGQFLAVGSFDNKARILNNITWKPLTEYSHTSTVTSTTATIFREVDSKQEMQDPSELYLTADTASSALPGGNSKYVVESTPVDLRVVRSDPKRGQMKLGCSVVEWSHDCMYLCTRNDDMPHVLWIWDTSRLCLVSVLIHLFPVRSVSWAPDRNLLMICCGGPRLYVWSTKGAMCVGIPLDNVNGTRVQWTADGSACVVSDRNLAVCVCYVGVGEEAVAEEGTGPSA